MNQVNITAKAVQTDGWWVAFFTINGRKHGTQAKRLDKLEAMVKEAASLLTDKPESDFTVTITIDMPQYIEAVQEYKEASKEADAAIQKAAQSSRAAVDTLKRAGLSVRDISTLMEISPQRVSQLANS